MDHVRTSLRPHVAWALLSVLLATGAAVAAHQEWFWRFDLALYDMALSLGRPAAPADVLIVAIDEASIARMGRWPWSRRLHAALIDHLTRDGARAVGLDLILSEPDRVDADADALLAAALRRSGRVVLPMLMEYDQRGAASESGPLPSLATAAASLGHIHFELDRDGIVRSAFLREGLNVPRHAHFAVELLRLAGYAPAEWPGARSPISRSDGWLRDRWVHFPFAGPPGTFTHVSYADVLSDRVPERFFRDRIVLIGATAAGLGDVYPTPVSGEGIPMPGVEISANLLAALRSGSTLVPATLATQVWLAAIPVLLLMFVYRVLSARWALLATIAGLACLTGTVVAALYWQRLWFPPAATAVFMFAAYPLWSWLRLEAAQRHLDDEFARLQGESGLLVASRTPDLTADPLERRMSAVRAATAQLRDMRRLLAQTLEGLPEAALVTNAQGRVVLANPRAQQYLEAAGGESFVGQPIAALLARLAPPEAPPGSHRWEALGPCGRQLLVCHAPLTTREGDVAGAIVSIVDVSALKEAQRNRDELLSYVSHDLRSPLASILALLQAQDEDSTNSVLGRIEHLTRRTLALAGDLVDLSRAEATEPRRFEDVDLAQLAHDAADEVWPQAEAKCVRIDRELDIEALVRGDAQLLRRALTNLLMNAVKYSPQGTRIRITIDRADAQWKVAIIDEGCGIAAEDLAHIFERHRRFRRPGQPPAEGSGLGLALVKTVAEKHGGSVTVASTSECGSRFELRIPAKSTAHVE
jgi:CHASE2 domain-containing sensor protein/signal transduction histidine kinase